MELKRFVFNVEVSESLKQELSEIADGLLQNESIQFVEFIVSQDRIRIYVTGPTIRGQRFFGGVSVDINKSITHQIRAIARDNKSILNFEF